MFYRFLADLVAVFHLGFVLFVVLGGFLVRRWRFLVWLHVPAVGWAALIEFSGWLCPLTPLENLFRRWGGAEGYKPGFIEHYILPILYPAGLNRSTQILLGASVLVLNLVAYRFVFRRPPVRKK